MEPALRRRPVLQGLAPHPRRPRRQRPERTAARDGGGLTDATDADLEGTGLALYADADALAHAERRALDFTEHEDARSTSRRAPRGTADSCTLPCERSLPKRNATRTTLERWNHDQSERLTGGFDPRSLIR